ncbi:ABC transporter ATP-binding protein [Fulvimonas soli]|uniref:Lipopolysaccharide transport system ATP-binding protein n=1 Tax=Fulvimonas soli TaxID=155197 RepID=A0A316I0E2_9GAMM|nr:ABC transporter ATP-binding protein [Fulvimonas soli]PWK85722.1 lipopolysaccharide transport system ATP-binding protein [Fulvimonas soli]TNY25671.1 sugar ABC transporter ATP-binding protein [Fulvimonas soli]
MLFDDVAISVRGISKRYEIYAKPVDRLKQMAVSGVHRLVGGRGAHYFREFWALRDIDLEVRRGECVAIIGRNGSGKSTLLQIICGTVRPTSGEVAIEGRVAALLELGSGFNPEFTGIENVYLNASLLGLSRDEVERKMDDILAFADIGDFVHQPVKTYSSGMAVRLAFAVQAQIDPDVLIVDEALAVGDARFQAKCFARLKTLRERGTSILLVTHSTEQVVTHCDRAVLIDRGLKLDEGEPRHIVNRYLDLLYGRIPVEGRGEDPGVKVPNEVTVNSQLQEWDAEFGERSSGCFTERPWYNPYEHRWGDRRAEIMDFAAFVGEQPFPQAVPCGAAFLLYVRYRFLSNIVRPIFGMTLKTKEGLTVYGTNTEMASVEAVPTHGDAGRSGVLMCSFRMNCAPGDYFISLGIASRDVNGEVVPHDRRYDSVHVRVEPIGSSFLGVTDLQAKLEFL